MKVPIQRNPEHHGDLPGRACGRLEVLRGRVRDGRDKEAVVLQCWSREGVYVWSCFRLGASDGSPIPIMTAIFCVDDNGPAGRERALVRGELV